MSKTPGSRRHKAENRRRSESPMIQTKSLSFGSLNDFQAIISGLMDNRHFLYNTAKNTSVIAACIQRIAKDVAKTPLLLTRRATDNSQQPFKSSKRYNHYLSKPNPTDTQYTFLYKLVNGLMVEGKVHILRLVKDKKNNFYVFQGRNVTLLQEDDGHQVYQLSFPNGKTLKVPDGDLLTIQIPGFDKNGDDSFSPLKAALEEVLLYQNLLRHQNNFSKNGMMARGFLQIAEGRLSFEQRQQLSREFTDRTSGLNAANTITLPSGVEYIPVQQNAQESASLELSEFAEDAVLRVYGIPKSVYDGDYASYSSADVQKTDYLQNTVAPLFKLIEDAVNEWSAITLNTEWFQFDRSELESAEAKKMKGESAESLARAAQIKQMMGIYSVNELRKQAGDEAIDDPLADENPIFNPEIEEQESTEEQTNEDGVKKTFYKSSILKEIQDEISEDGKD